MNLHQLSAKMDDLIQFERGRQVERLWKSTPVSPVLGSRQYDLSRRGLAAARGNLMEYMKRSGHLPSELNDPKLRAHYAERMQAHRDEMAENILRIRAAPKTHWPISWH